MLREQYDVGAKPYYGDALVELEPALKPGVAAGAWHYLCDSHLRPDRLMSELRRILTARGVEILERCEFRWFVQDAQGAKAAVTSKGELAADAFVVATGAWTPKLNDAIGCKVPIEPGKGYSITMPRPAICPKIPMLFEEQRVGITPWASGYRIGSTMEFAGYDTTLNRKRLDLLLAGAKIYLREPTCEPIEEEWYGWRPMTYDSKPVIDRSPRIGNVWIAAGHNMLGLSMATVTGKLIMELITDQPPHLDVRPYAATRFA